MYQHAHYTISMKDQNHFYSLLRKRGNRALRISSTKVKFASPRRWWFSSQCCIYTISSLQPTMKHKHNTNDNRPKFTISYFVVKHLLTLFLHIFFKNLPFQPLQRLQPYSCIVESQNHEWMGLPADHRDVLHTSSSQWHGS